MNRYANCAGVGSMAGTITFRGALGVKISVPYNATMTDMNTAAEAIREPVDYMSLPLWWLSFVDPDKAPPPEQQVPGGPSFLGACIVPGYSFIEAIDNASALGCNPGGAVKAIPTTAPDASWIGRLLSSADIDRLDEIEKHSPAGGEQ